MVGVKRFAEILSCKDLHDSVTARRDHEASILAPDHAADALTTHDSVSGDLLRADALVERPETNRGVMPGGHGFATVLAQREGGDGGRVGQHAVCALT